MKSQITYNEDYSSLFGICDDTEETTKRFVDSIAALLVHSESDEEPLETFQFLSI